MFLMLHIIHSSRYSWSWFSYHSVKRIFVTTFPMMVNKSLLGQTSDKLNQSNNKTAEDISLFQLYSPHQRVQPGWSRPQIEQSRAGWLPRSLLPWPFCSTFQMEFPLLDKSFALLTHASFVGHSKLPTPFLSFPLTPLPSLHCFILYFIAFQLGVFRNISVLQIISYFTSVLRSSCDPSLFHVICKFYKFSIIHITN